MPRESVDAWQEVARSAADLAGRIRDHFAGHLEERESAASEASRRELTEALEAFRRQVGGAFEAIADALHDPAVRQDAVRTSRAIAGAVEASVTDLGDEVRQTAERLRHRG
jgi:hypothetical protein